MPFYISDVRQIRALASPVRAAIVDALEASGPATILEVARPLGYPPDGLYYHFHSLERFGLVVRAGVDKTTKALKYDLPAHNATLRYRLADPAHRDATAAVVGTMLRHARRSFRRAYTPALARSHGPFRNLRAGRRTAWLTRRELAVLNRYVERIHALFGRGRPGRPGARLHEFTYVLAPMIPKTRR